MWDTPLQVVKPGKGDKSYGRAVETLDPDKGATVESTVHRVECQPASTEEMDDGGRRIHVTTTWKIITRPGHMLDGLTARDGVLVEGIDGVLEVVGDVGRVQHPRLGHAEFIVKRWVG